MTAVLAAWNFHRITHFDVWGVLFWLNAIVLLSIVGVLVYTTFRRRPVEERPPANEVAFLDDDELEGPRLERVLGWSLFFFAVFAITMPLYWLRETTRQQASVKYFSQNAVDRGEVLFSNIDTMPTTFDPATSLRCADCHGAAGSGGSGAAYTYTDAVSGRSYNVLWRAPALNTVLYRFSPQEVHDIITYGRPGTPMQPWGVAGGGPKNDQSVNDLVAYIQSIQLPPGTTAEINTDIKNCSNTDPTKNKAAKTALGTAQCALIAARNQPAQQLSDAQANLAAAKKTLADDTKAFQTADADPNKDGVQTCVEVLADPKTYPPGDIRAACTQLQFKTQSHVDPNTGKTVEGTDQVAVDQAQSAVAWAQQWKARRVGVTDGQLLFEINCARCHTLHWSIFDPAGANDTTLAGLKPENLLGPPGGGGQNGFNLRDGQEQRRFPNIRSTTGAAQANSGVLSQIAFVVNGSDANVPYGVGGIGTGRSGGMPGQCNVALKTNTSILPLKYYGCEMTYSSDPTNLAGTPVLTDNPKTAIDDVMIEQIVLYERCGLDLTDDTLAPPSSDYASGCS
jgi:mono/diheme cytochrome c family protein